MPPYSVESVRGGLHAATCFQSMDSTEEVAEWLDAIGMSSYIPVFRAQQVTGNTLLSLNSVELQKTLGITKLRDRRFLLDSIHYLDQALSIDTRKVLPEDGRILTHLSNERIFLAWVRFSVLLQTAAIASLRLVNRSNERNDVYVRAIAGLISALAIIAALYGTARYYWMHRLAEEPGAVHMPGRPKLLSPVMFVCIGAVVALHAIMAGSTEDAAILALLSL